MTIKSSIQGRVPQDDRLLNILHACQNGRLTCRKAAERIENLFARRSVGPSWFFGNQVRK